MTTDPMERIIEAALIDAGIRYTTGCGGGTAHRLDFDLPDHGVAIEVKRLHSPRIAGQMARAENVIVAQGEAAVRLLADALRALPRGDDRRTLPAMTNQERDAFEARIAAMSDQEVVRAYHATDGRSEEADLLAGEMELRAIDD